MTAASQRFRDHIRWARKIVARWRFAEDVEQAGLIGLLLADRAAPADMPEAEFRRYAAVRVRGEALDHLRRVAHGGRRQGRTTTKPHVPDPESVAMAQDLGLVHTKGYGGDALARELDPEAQALANETELEQAATLRRANLTDRQRLIISRRLAGDESRAIAADLGLSAPRVSQILGEAIAKIRDAR